MTPDAACAALARIVGHVPQDPALFLAALTHGSSNGPDYQRLEFLGDRVLGLTIATELYHRHPGADEGELAARFNALVSGDTCAELVRALGLPPLVQMGPQAINDGTRYSEKIAADIMESVIGALYLDAGLDSAQQFIRAHWAALLDGQRSAPKHPKAALQEWASAQGRRPPEYQLVSRDGPDHAPRFRVMVSIGKLGSAEGEASSKQQAETAAAAALLDQLAPSGGQP